MYTLFTSEAPTQLIKQLRPVHTSYNHRERTILHHRYHQCSIFRPATATASMGRIMPGMALAFALVAMLCAGASAQSGCTTVIVGLAPCMAYIMGNSSAPASPCCSQLAGVVRSQPQCLCMILNGGAALLGVTLNQTRALALPTACNMQTPPVSLCNNAVAGGPAASPDASPPVPSAPAAPSEPSSPTSPAASSTPSVPSGSSPATPSTPATNMVPSGNGSKTTQASGGSSTTMAMLPFFMLLFMASYALSLGPSF